jgi:hypothetical protein
MAYPNDLVGKAIQLLQLPPASGQKQNFHIPASVNVAIPVFKYTAERAGIGGKPSTMPRFENMNAPWNVSFLHYIPGEVTTANLSRPVLTGPMSGCFLFRYVAQGTRVSHVGTADDRESQQTQNAKADWKAFLAQSGATAVMGGAPADYFNDAERTRAKVGRMSAMPSVYGLFEPNGDAYAVLLAPILIDALYPGHTQPQRMMLFAALKRMNLQPWTPIISAMPKWR